MVFFIDTGPNSLYEIVAFSLFNNSFQYGARAKRMNRRRFLGKGISFLAGSLLGFNAISEALAAGVSLGRSAWPRIALIIDDIGYSRSRARQFYDLGVPLTFSILPRLAYSYDLALEIHDQGREIMLHQPMEPYDPNFDPGPGALYTGYGVERIVRILKENVSHMPYVIGVNNHMGSRFTSSRPEIDSTLRVIRHQGLFFVDSVTSGESKAYETARMLHMAAAKRNVFLDNRLNESAIMKQLFKLKDWAYQHGYAIGIGHPFPETARAIRYFAKNLDRHEVSFVPVSRLIDV